MGLIYVLVNEIDGKLYVGQTSCNRRKRWREHCCSSRSTKPRTRLHRAMKKHGIDNFRMEVIDFADSRQELNQKEVAWIERLHSTDSERGYNLTAGGDGCPFPSQEVGEKIGLATRNRWQDPKMRKHYQENVWTPERRAEASRKAKERLSDPEIRANMVARHQIIRECQYCHNKFNGRDWQKHKCILAPPKEKKQMTKDERKARYGSWRGKTVNPEIVEKRSESTRKSWTPEKRLAWSERMRARWTPEMRAEHGKAMSARIYPKRGPMSAEQRAQQSVIMQGRKIRIGIKNSQEANRNVAEAAVRGWIKRRANQASTLTMEG